MLEIKKVGISLEPEELIDLERILIDEDESEALKYLKKSVYNKIARSQSDRLKNHLDVSGDPVDMFKTGGKGR
ncbi:hypothetical protein ACFLVR_04725 [Chloroflexota bacterium]